jgi:hypothetical protein
MKKPEKIEPKNLTAQLHYRGKGNPPGSHPSSAVSNSYPGLEMDFRNIWKNIFEGIVLLEYSNLVTEVEDDADKKIKALVADGLEYELIMADGKKMTAPLSGPAHRHGRQLTGNVALEWSNALSEILPKAGQFVRCTFQNNVNRRKHITLNLKVRHFFDVDLNRNGNIVSQRVVVARAMAGPGDLTQSLCSPWQNDYRECGCFYWAASRPDYVNVEPGVNGKSKGNYWMEKERKGDPDPAYIVDDYSNVALITYDELFIGWEQALRFIIAGKDEPPLKPSK